MKRRSQPFLKAVPPSTLAKALFSTTKTYRAPPMIAAYPISIRNWPEPFQSTGKATRHFRNKYRHAPGTRVRKFRGSAETVLEIVKSYGGASSAGIDHRNPASIERGSQVLLYPAIYFSWMSRWCSFFLLWRYLWVGCVIPKPGEQLFVCISKSRFFVSAASGRKSKAMSNILLRARLRLVDSQLAAACPSIHKPAYFIPPAYPPIPPRSGSFPTPLCPPPPHPVLFRPIRVNVLQNLIPQQPRRKPRISPRKALPMRGRILPHPPVPLLLLGPVVQVVEVLLDVAALDDGGGARFAAGFVDV